MKIVLTGGPGAGKSSISARLAAEHPRRFVRVPEAASQIYAATQTRWNLLDLQGRRVAQRQIYQLQIEQEAAVAMRHPRHTLLLDRGTVDGAAYWPDGPDDYWQQLHTSLQQEMARYFAVLWLQTSAALGLYDHDQSNPVRFEDEQGAIAGGQMLIPLWASHPRFLRIPAFIDFDEKVVTVLRAIDELTHSITG